MPRAKGDRLVRASGLPVRQWKDLSLFKDKNDSLILSSLFEVGQLFGSYAGTFSWGEPILSNEKRACSGEI